MRKLLLILFLFAGVVNAQQTFKQVTDECKRLGCHIFVETDDVLGLQCPVPGGWFIITALKKYGTASDTTLDDPLHLIHMWEQKPPLDSNGVWHE